jgi:CBS domain-containing protein
MKVRQAMHEHVEWREPETSVAELAKVMRDEDIGSVPIGENDRLVGMVTDRDLALRSLTKSGDVSGLTARDVMSKGIIYCEDDDSVEEAIALMQARQVRRLPVIDDNKRMVGKLSLGDISHAASQSKSGALVKSVSAHH